MVNAGTVTPDLRTFPDDRDALRHDGQARQERQDAALGRHSERRTDRRHSGPMYRAGENHEASACSRSLEFWWQSAATAARAAEEPLKVCLDENLPPFSAHHRGKPDTGFDVALAQAIADRLGRPLKIQWFESKLDEDSSPALEANALLSDGRCSLVGGYALTQGLAGSARRQDRKTAGFRGRHPRRPPPAGAARRAGAERALYLFAADHRARRQGARPQDFRRRRSRRTSHCDRKRHARRRHPDDLRQGPADRRHHPSGPRAQRSARRARSRRL